MVQGYCVKCKKKVEIQNGVESTTKRGGRIMKGKCATCKITVCAMLPKD